MSKLSILEQLKARKAAAPNTILPEATTPRPATPPAPPAPPAQKVVVEVRAPESSSASACTDESPPPSEPAAPARSGSIKDQVLEFIGSQKLVGVNSIPVKGASNIEIAAAFPDQNANSLRYVVWNLRKSGQLVDSGIRRTFGSSKIGQVVWVVAAKDAT